MNKFLLKVGFILLLSIFIGGCIEVPNNEKNSTRGNFEALWKIIDTRYCYLDYKHIDWDSIYWAFKPRVDTVKSQLDYFDLLGEMLATLADGHVNLYSSFDRSRYTKWYTDFPRNFDSDLLYSDRYLGKNYRIAGGIMYNTVANGKVGYIRYGSFSQYFSDTNIFYIFRFFKNCKGIIIDVRDNGGGSIDYSEQLASYFFQAKTLTGHIIHKIGNGHSDFSEPTPIYTHPHKKVRWSRPIVVLTNRMSYSATNDFVNRIRYREGCTLVGDRTGGGGGIPLSSELPNGWMVRFSASPILDAEKQNIEWGIQPDISISMLSEDNAKGYDNIIEKGINILLNE